MLIRQIIVSGGFDWIDLETDIADQIKRFKSTKRIISYHNLKQVPEDLDDIYDRMCGQDPDMSRSRSWPEACPTTRSSSTCSSGRRSRPSRSAWATWAFRVACSRGLRIAVGLCRVQQEERGIAPGMPSYAGAKLFRIGRVHDGSKCYAVVGDPVSHSFSPLVHNAAFNSLGMDSLYVPIFGLLAASSRRACRLSGPLSTASVTIPHKEVAAHDAASRDATVDETHAANTLVRGPKGFTAYNTDYQAFLDTLLAALPNKDLHKVPVLILGSGGMAARPLTRWPGPMPRSGFRAQNHDATKRLADEVEASRLNGPGGTRRAAP